MVEILSNWLMISLFPSRGVSVVFSFGSCKEGWYFRCIGVDP
ncbi:hypothetical protein DCAR_0208250 [Daucus carota subsp. sativus]|uniref:Uncharacterized protein n=1 Tax=Daucus carota subsp. sativus TaxID=79200 RepID=A0AAF0WG26_DAUCS|nr:hypothetical protein DCAR_0208250 [Daucus carota subsp. sativus]